MIVIWCSWNSTKSPARSLRRTRVSTSVLTLTEPARMISLASAPWATSPRTLSKLSSSINSVVSLNSIDSMTARSQPARSHGFQNVKFYRPSFLRFEKQSLQYTGRSSRGLNGTSHSFLQSAHVALCISRGPPYPPPPYPPPP